MHRQDLLMPFDRLRVCDRLFPELARSFVVQSTPGDKREERD